MIKRVAILRGINVGGRRKILMADLKALISKLAFKDVTTYIQSGNVIFNAKDKIKNNEIEDKITKAIKKKYDFDVPVIVKTENEFNEIISTNPFEKGEEIERLHFTFLKEIPAKEHLEKMATYDYSPDQFEIQGSNVFVFCSKKYSDTKLTNKFFESKLKTTATTRNWKTILKISQLMMND